MLIQYQVVDSTTALVTQIAAHCGPLASLGIMVPLFSSLSKHSDTSTCYSTVHTVKCIHMYMHAARGTWTDMHAAHSQA
jgi:hypothetical protein